MQLGDILKRRTETARQLPSLENPNAILVGSSIQIFQRAREGRPSQDLLQHSLSNAAIPWIGVVASDDPQGDVERNEGLYQYGEIVGQGRELRIADGLLRIAEAKFALEEGRCGCRLYLKS